MQRMKKKIRYYGAFTAHSYSKCVVCIKYINLKVSWETHLDLWKDTKKP